MTAMLEDHIFLLNSVSSPLPSYCYGRSPKPFGCWGSVPWRVFFPQTGGCAFMLPGSCLWASLACTDQFLLGHRPVPIHGPGVRDPVLQHSIFFHILLMRDRFIVLYERYLFIVLLQGFLIQILTELVEYNLCKETCNAETQTSSALYKESLGKFSIIIDLSSGNLANYLCSLSECVYILCCCC